MSLTLFLANKNYSSWSFRPWILMRHFGIAFDEIVIPLAQDFTQAEILRVSPSGKCPALQDGDITVWDSLAIIEYLAWLYPDKPLWPKSRAARAKARSPAAEMHSGFMGLRSLLPMNMRRAVMRRELTPEASADVARIEAAFQQARGAFGQAGAFLFGEFSAADAMFAPVVNRLHVYDVPVTPATRAYMDAMMALSAIGDILKLIWCAVIGLFGPRASLEAKILALRHQLNVLRRKSPKRLAFGNFGRLVFASLYRIVPRIVNVLEIIEPETIVLASAAASYGI